jgi:hypothetical protein
MFDWLHNSEGLTVFNLQGLSDPNNRAFRQRARRYAGFYLNEDPAAPNYDPQHKIIRSLFNGSRGPPTRRPMRPRPRRPPPSSGTRSTSSAPTAST